MENPPVVTKMGDSPGRVGNSVQQNTAYFNKLGELSAEELVQLKRCGMAAMLLLSGICMGFLLLFVGLIIMGLRVPSNELRLLTYGMMALGIIACVSSLLGQILVMFGPKKSRANELFRWSFCLVLISPIAPIALSFVEHSLLKTGFYRLLLTAAILQVSVLLFLAGWKRLGEFVQVETVVSKIKRAVRCFVVGLIVPLVVLLTLPWVRINMNVSSLYPGISPVLRGILLFSIGAILLTAAINYANALTLCRKALNSVSIGRSLPNE
jgi:hypothetical protein